eukprot:gene11447-4695_t
MHAALRAPPPPPSGGRIARAALRALLLTGQGGDGAGDAPPCETRLETLCRLLETVGAQLDHKEARVVMDYYASRLRALSQDARCSKRIQFLLVGVLERRARGWESRRPGEGPMTLRELDDARNKKHLQQLSALTSQPSTSALSTLSSGSAVNSPTTLTPTGSSAGGLSPSCSWVNRGAAASSPAVTPTQHSPTQLAGGPFPPTAAPPHSPMGGMGGMGGHAPAQLLQPPPPRPPPPPAQPQPPPAVQQRRAWGPSAIPPTAQGPPTAMRAPQPAAQRPQRVERVIRE